MINKIFVYGTLQKGMCNDRFIPENTTNWRKKFSITGDLYEVKGAYFPALLLPGDSTVYGELIEIKDKCCEDVIQRCDTLEGHPHLYIRTIVPIKIDGEMTQCYTYVFNRHEILGNKIKSGRFESKDIKLN